MPLIAMLIILIVLLVVVALAVNARGGRRYTWSEFYRKTKASGLSVVEARRLREAATRSGLADPTSILSSPHDMDRVIADISSSLRAEGHENNREGIVLMDHLYTLRKQIELEQPRFKQGIASSRQVGNGQRLRVLVKGIGVFNATVIDNSPQYIVISYPSGGNVLLRDMVWKGKKISIYFWRREDAGYVFDSYVIDDLRIRNLPVLQISHSEALLRTQKRGSVRARSKIPAFLYILQRIGGAYEKPERVPGLRAMVLDISDDGAAVAIGGKAVPGLPVKLQFGLGEKSVVMSGTVRSVDFDPTANRSILHIEALKPSPRMRNAIRSFVYNVHKDEEVPEVDQ